MEKNGAGLCRQLRGWGEALGQQGPAQLEGKRAPYGPQDAPGRLPGKRWLGSGSYNE